MQTISTKIVLEIGDELGSYREVERHSYAYDGPVHEMKAGKGAQKQNTNFQQGQAQNSANNANSAFTSANNFFNNEMSTTPGQMSSSAAATYANDLDAINGTYNGLRQNLFASMNSRGYGAGAPSGFLTSSLNSLNRQQGASQEGAYNQGQISTQQQGQAGAAGEAALYGTAANNEAQNTNAATNSAASQFQMGQSTLGSILGAASSIIPGISGLSSLITGSNSNAQVPQTPSPSVNDVASAIGAVPGLNTYNANAKPSNSSVGSF